MKKYLFIVLLVGVCFGQDTYPYFSEPNKQTQFEDKRVYIVEKSGSEQHLSGGKSYITMANRWRHVLRGENPQYVVKNKPIKTHYEYYYEFKIKKGAKILNELEFLLEAGYNDKAKQVYNIYEKTLTPYRNEYRRYEEKLNYFYSSNNKTTKEKIVFKESFEGQAVLGGCFLIYGLSYFLNFSAFIEEGDTGKIITSGIPLLAIGFMLMNPSIKKYDESSLKKPVKPIEPTLNQVLSNEQIKSLAESYNRRLYDEIAKK
jgi:hypothetical protein